MAALPRIATGRRLARFLEQEVSEFWLCPVSVQEMLYKWRHRSCRAPDPAEMTAEATKVIGRHRSP